MRTGLRFEDILSAVDEIVYRVSITGDSLSGRVTFVGPQIKRILGYESAEVSDSAGLFFGILHPDDVAVLRQQSQQPIERGGARTIQYRLRHKITGEYRWVEDRAIGEQDEEGRLVGIVGAVRDITERKRAEEALRDSQAQLALIFEQLPGSLWTTDRDLRITSARRGAGTRLDFAPEQQVGRTIYDLFPGADRDFPPIATHLRALDGEPGAYDIHYLDKDWSVRIRPLHNADGLVIGCIGESIDITERKRAHGALTASEAKLRAFIEAAPDAIVGTDSEGRVILANTQSEQLFGYPREEMLGRPVELLIPERFREVHTAHRAVFRAAPRHRALGRDLSLYGQRKDGTEFPVEIALSPVHTADGLLVMSIVRDLTERKRAEEKLRESEQRFRRLFEEGPVGVALLDTQLRLMRVNGAGCRMLGYTESELAGLSFPEITHPEDREVAAPLLPRLLAGEIQSYQNEKRLVTKQKAVIWAHLTATVIRGRDGKPLYGLAVMQDITERKRAEAERLQMEERLSRSRQQLRDLARRMRSIREKERTDIARQIHDEFGQLLTALKIDLSRLRIAPSEAAGSQANDIQSMVALIDQMIEKVRTLAAELRPPMLDDLGLVAALEWEAQKFGRRVGVRCSLEAPRHVPIDSERATDVFRILQEALTNVARHAHASEVRITLGVTAVRLVLEVLDDGIGISDYEIANPQAFGLVGMRERTLRWEGEFSVNRTLPAGTCLRVTIPLGPREPG